MSGPASHRRCLNLAGDRIRLLLITNETTPGADPGLRVAYERMLRKGEIAMLETAAPSVTAALHGEAAAASELLNVGRHRQPNVVLVQALSGVRHDLPFVRRLLGALGDPVLLCWQGDPWQRWRKPITASMRAWLGAADVVFTPARRPQSDLLKRSGARDVRFMPQTYNHFQFRRAEETDPRDGDEPRFDAVLIGGCYAHAGLPSRLPGAAARASLVRRLQRRRDLRVAIYGSGWTGRGVHGPVPYARQTDVIRRGLMSVNWDHFPRHERYTSDRLPISLIAGRVHVTTKHKGYDWLPGPEIGLFFESSVRNVVRRVTELAGRPTNELLELGAAGHRWVKGRLSDRELAAFMLGAVDERFLSRIPVEPWHRFVAEWPETPGPVKTS